MANKTLFNSATSHLPRADVLNEAGGRAYRLPPKHALAQLAATGCFNGTYYATADSHLDTLLALAAKVDDNLFLAKLAVYSRQRAFMKDMPAALLLILSKRDPALFQIAFDRVVDNGRVLRTLFQMLRSGRFGRKSLSYSLQRAFQRWLNNAGAAQLLAASIGNDPSLRDVMRLARPTPKDNARRAFFGWLTDKPAEKWAPATTDDLPEEVQALRAFRAAQSELEQIDILTRAHFRWDLLADAVRGPAVWKAIAGHMGPQALRMNLNTLLRHEVFTDDPVMVRFVADRLGHPDEIKRGRQFPYQYLAAYLNAEGKLPHKIKSALGKAAEIACGNVPQLPGPVIIGLDVSGSMSCAVTGNRGAGATSKMRCVDVAALFAAAILRCNPDSVLVPFDDRIHRGGFDPDDSILSLASRLAKFGGGTNCSLPLAEANGRLRNRHFVGCILVSDGESWIGQGRHGSTAVLTEWQHFVKNQTQLHHGGEFVAPKLVCIDLQPYTTVQAPDRDDILNVGGFSDAVLTVVASFLSDDTNRFVTEVEAVAL
jgi:60 kDa SS-A/Ro ribonucleoprotein